MRAMGSLHGFEIDCDRELRRLSCARGELGRVRVRSVEASPLERDGELLRLIAGANGNPASALARCDGRPLYWHADSGSFLVDAVSGLVSYRREDAVTDGGAARWEHRLGSSVLPVLGGERGGLALHASAVSVGGRALVICGVTGRGKSTLAATLVARGHEAIAEDGVVIDRDREESVVWPGLAGAMVTAGVATAIGLRGAREGGPDPRGRLYAQTPVAAGAATPVGAVAILFERGGDRVELTAPTPAKAHRELLAHAIGAGRRGAGAFAASARLIERVPVRLLVVPDSVAELPVAAEALERLTAPEISTAESSRVWHRASKGRG